MAEHITLPLEFKPNLNEMENFEKYVKYTESLGAYSAGIAKIIPPEEWKQNISRFTNNISENFIIEKPMEQTFQCQANQNGIYLMYTNTRKSMTLNDLRMYSLHKGPSKHANLKDVETNYWQNLPDSIYGCDISASFFRNEVKLFNLNKLNTSLDLIGRQYKTYIPGVTSPFLYIGSWASSFAYHIEDLDLLSISYLHSGSKKVWYVIPPRFGHQFECLMKDMAKNCPAFLRHKCVLISPEVLRCQFNIPVLKVVQNAGEFIITYPFAYHQGFNSGFNISESINFSTRRWLECAKFATLCSCHNQTSVKFSLDAFKRHYEPETYSVWREGKEFGVHPYRPGSMVATIPTDKSFIGYKKFIKKRKRENEKTEKTEKMRKPI